MEDRVFTCTACDTDVSADVESTPKLFKFHVKRNHKQQLRDYDSADGIRHPYREFLDDEDVDKITSDDVPL